MVLGYYGTNATEEEIGRRAKTTVSHGTSPDNLLRAARAYGFDGRWKGNGTIADLRGWFDAGVPVIVNWFSTNEGHYSVVVGVDDARVVLADPETGNRRSLDHETFMRVWFDFPFPWIEKPSQLRIRFFLPLRPR